MVCDFAGATDYPCFRGLLKQLVGPLSTQLVDRRSSIVKQMLARGVIEDILHPFISQTDLDAENDGHAMSSKVLSKIVLGPSSLALLERTALMATYIRKSDGHWTYQEVKSMISDAVEMSQLMDLKEIERDVFSWPFHGTHLSITSKKL